MTACSILATLPAMSVDVVRLWNRMLHKFTKRTKKPEKPLSSSSKLMVEHQMLGFTCYISLQFYVLQCLTCHLPDTVRSEWLWEILYPAMIQGAFAEVTENNLDLKTEYSTYIMNMENPNLLNSPNKTPVVF